jgi:ubiquinone/menaquinone biosynthesis C-methylase UbiE
VRASGYESRIYELGYAWSGPLYDWIVRYGLFPLGGHDRCRRRFAEWFELRPGQHVASLCCGTGSTDRAMLAAEPRIGIVGIDLGTGQLTRARRLDPRVRIDYRRGDARDTGLDAGSFDRVVIVLALHEMPRTARLDVLAEARRLCRADGRVIAVEHNRPRRLADRILQGLCWLYWVPGNPEARTSLDLQRYGLAAEMREAGLAPLERRVTRPEWIEAVTARPAAPTGGSG